MMNNFNQAQQEYESKLTSPYDRGGALFDEEEYQREKEDYLDWYAECQMEEMKLSQTE